MKEHNNKLQELELLKATTIENMWLSELIKLETEYLKFIEERKDEDTNKVKNVKKTKTVKKLKIDD